MLNPILSDVVLLYQQFEQSANLFVLISVSYFPEEIFGLIIVGVVRIEVVHER